MRPPARRSSSIGRHRSFPKAARVAAGGDEDQAERRPPRAHQRKAMRGQAAEQSGVAVTHSTRGRRRKGRRAEQSGVAHGPRQRRVVVNPNARPANPAPAGLKPAPNQHAEPGPYRRLRTNPRRRVRHGRPSGVWQRRGTPQRRSAHPPRPPRQLSASPSRPPPTSSTATTSTRHWPAGRSRSRTAWSTRPTASSSTATPTTPTRPAAST